MKLQERTSDSAEEEKPETKDSSKEIADLGMQIRNLQLREQELYNVVSGVVVVSVKEDGAAAKARLGRGDVILSVDGEEVQTTNAFNNIIAKFNAGDVIKLKLRILRGDGLFDRLVFMQIPE